MTKPRILITGASGFLGSRLARLLVESGQPVKLMLRHSSSRRAFAGLPADMVEVAEGDITIGHTVYRALAGCDRLYHVAANFKMWDAKPERILDASIVGTRETLEAAKARGVEKIVVTSSVAAVGASEDPNVVMDESWPWNRGDSETYIVAKRKAEEIALGYAAAGLPVVLVNPAGIFGPGDWKPTPTGQTVLQYLAWSLPGGFPWSDGGVNVVDVDDVARGHVLAMEKGRVGERYILGGDNLTIREIVEAMYAVTGIAKPGYKASKLEAVLTGSLMELAARIFGFEPMLTHKLARDFTDAYAWVSSAKAERELGYTHRPGKAAIARSIRWFVDNGYVPAEARSRIRLDLRHISA